MRQWVDAFGEHKLLTYATAIAMQSLIGLAGLVLLAIAILGKVGQRAVWEQHVGPAIATKLTVPTYTAINDAVEKVFLSDTTGLIAFATAFAVWEVSGAMRAVMDALNSIVGQEENRSTVHRFALSFLLAVVTIVLVACAVLVVSVSAKLEHGGGALHWTVAVLRWPAGAVFLGLAVGIVARLAPTEHRGAKWASAGAAMIVVAWLAESVVFALFVKDVSNYKTASGNLLLLLVVTTYLYISAIAFLMGVQLDEFLRDAATGGETVTIHELVRRAF